MHHDKSPFGVVQGAGSINVKQLHLQVLSCWFLPDRNREVLDFGTFANPSNTQIKGSIRRSHIEKIIADHRFEFMKITKSNRDRVDSRDNTTKATRTE